MEPERSAALPSDDHRHRRRGETIDTTTVKTGFRTTTFDANEGFSLNGEKMKLKGVAMHHDQGALGARAYRAAIARQIDILKEMGANTRFESPTTRLPVT